MPGIRADFCSTGGVAGQMGIAMSELALQVLNIPQGWVRLSSHAAMAGALYYDHRNPVSYNRVYSPRMVPRRISGTV